MYFAGFWIPRDQGVRLGKWILTFLQSYHRCAVLAFQAGQNRWPLMPKLHFIHHDALKLIHCPAHAKWCINPLATSDQMQEDFVGRPSRLSRRVSVQQIHLRVAQRSLISAYTAIQASDRDERGLI